MTKDINNAVKIAKKQNQKFTISTTFFSLSARKEFFIHKYNTRFLVFIFFFSLSSLLVSTSNAQVSGVVFRDFNADGIKNANEPYISGVTVNAYLANASTPCGTAVSSGNTAPNYTLSGCGTADVRVEFILPATGACVDNIIDFSSFQGIDNGSSVQFVKGNSANIDFAIANPNDYNQGVSGVSVYLPTYVSGNPLPVGSASGAESAFVGYPYTNNGPSTLAPTQSVSASKVGSTWGVAYSKQAKKVFTAAFLKRHVGLGPLGSGGIYMLTPTATSFTVNNFYDMDANGHQTRAASTAPAYGEGTSYTIASNSIATYLGANDVLTGQPSGLGVIGTNPQRGLDVDPTQPSYDPAAFDQVGKVGLGGLEISDDGKYLFVMNLYSRKVFRLTLNSAANPTAVTSVTSYALPSVSCNNGKLRPFALRYHRGKLYVGVVCSGEDGGQNIINGATDLRAYVYELNNPTATATFNTTPIINVPLNYLKDGSDNWLPWNNDSDLGGSQNPTPLLSDIEFTDRGDIILDFVDRSGHQWGFNNYKFLKINTTTIQCVTGGDIIIAGLNCNGTFTVENDGTITSVNNITYTSAHPTNTMGIGGGEFFYDDSNCGDPHDETSSGAIATLRGTGEVYATVFAGSLESADGGIVKLSTTNGDYVPNSSYTLYNRFDFTGKSGKANGLGDVEFSGIEAPIEIGNRVFVDTDADGIQDAGETGIANVSVELYADFNNDGIPDGAVLGTTTTSTTAGTALGTWYFNTANVSDGDPTIAGNQVGPQPNKRYLIRVATADWTSGAGIADLLGKVLTTADVGGAGQPDVRDSDASLVNSIPQISVLLGNTGENNHTLDMGFICLTPSFTGITVNQATCTGTTANNNASIVVTSSSGDKAAYSLGTTYTGVAYASATALSSGSITFGSLANPTGGQAYTIRLFNTAFCYKDSTVILKRTICYAMCGATNIFQNNSFETGTFSSNNSYVDPNNAQSFANANTTTNVTNWYVDNGNWINDNKRASDASKFVVINNDGACWSDKINVGTGAADICNGATYELCFDYASFDPLDPTNLTADNTELAVEFVNFSTNAPQVKRLVGAGVGGYLLKDATTNTTAFAAGAQVIVPTASWDNLRYGIKPIAQAGWHRGCTTFTTDFSGFYFTGPVTTMGFAFSKVVGKDLLIDNVKLTKCSGTCVVPPTVTSVFATAATCTGLTPNTNASITIAATGGDKVGISSGTGYYGAAYSALTSSLSGGTYTFTGLPASTDVPGEFYTVRIFNGNNYAYKDTTILIPYSNCANKCIADQFHYATPQVVDVPWGGANPVTASSYVAAATIVGGERDIVLTRTAGTSTFKLEVASWDLGVIYMYSGQPNELGTATITYDGVDNNATTVNYAGLAGMAMNKGSFTLDTEIDNTTPIGTVNFTIRVYSSAANWSYKTLSISTATGYSTLTFTPSTFIIGGGTGANFASVGAVQLITSNTVAGTGWRMKNFFMPCVCINPTPIIGSNSPVCVGSTINLTSGGGTTYAWSGPSAFSSTLQNPSRASATTAMAGTYTVTVTDASGCTATASRTVVVPTLSISAVSVSPCINHPLQDVANVSVTLTWTNAPSGDDIKVTINNKIEYISVSSGLTSPQTIVFVVPANGANNNNITAAWVNASCTATATFNAPAACSSDAICEKVLYLCGPNKPADGDAWDHGFMDYLAAVGVSAMTPAYTLPDVAGYGLYDPMNTSTVLSINLNDYTMIVISPTTEWYIAANLLTALKGYSGGILMMNYAEVDDLGMTNGNAFYNWQNNAYINNTSQINIYNYDNINPVFGLVQTGANYFSNADASLWFGASNMSAGNNGINFNYTASDVLSGVPATHGARVYLGFHSNGLYENAQNAGAIPAPASSYFTPTKHLTIEAKVYLDNAIKNAATGIQVTATGDTKCAGATINLTATGIGISTYAWSGPAAFSSALQNPTRTNATAAMAGTYTVTVTSSNGCTKTATAIVVVNTVSAPTVTSVSRCGTGTVTLGASGCAGGTLKWYAAATGGASLGAGTNFTTPSIAATTTYYVDCTAASGCTSTTRTAVTATILNCGIALRTCNLTDGYDTWAGYPTFPLAWAMSGVGETYVLDGTPSFTAYTNGSIMISGSLKGNAVPVVNPSGTDANKKYNFNILLTQQKDWTTWSAGGGMPFYPVGQSPPYTTWNYYILSSGMMVGTGLNAGLDLSLTHFPTDFSKGFQEGIGANFHESSFGLGGWTTFVRTDGVSNIGDFIFRSACTCPGFTASISGTNAICNGTSTTLTASATNALSYLWNTGATTAVISVNPSTTTTYTVTVTNTSNCTASSSTTVTVTAPPNAGLGTTAAMCKSEISSTTNLYTLLTGEQAGGTWSAIAAFPAGMTAAIINAKITSGVLERKGFPAGIYTLQYIVTGTSPCPNDTENVTVTVNACCPPVICMPLATKRF
jgi:hypothetical protein